MKLFRLLALLALASFIGIGAQAQSAYPNRTVRLVVTNPPGGGTDTIARLVAQHLGELWKQTVVVDNRPGASGNVAGQYVARSAPDGYTLLAGFGGFATINPLTMKDMGVDPHKDLVPVSMLASSPMYLVVNPAVVPARSMADFLSYARSSPVPLSWGSAAGSADALAGQMLGMMTGIRLTHVPYKGGAEALVDVLAGRVPFGVFSMTAAMSHLKSGQLLALGATQKTRSGALPAVPSISELVPGYEAATWYGIWAPAGTPAPVLEKISADVRQVLQSDGVKKRASELGLDVIGNTPAEFAMAVRAELQRHEKAIAAMPAKN